MGRKESNQTNKTKQVIISKKYCIFSLKDVFILANNVYPDEMPHIAAFQHGLNCFKFAFGKWLLRLAATGSGDVSCLFDCIDPESNSYNNRWKCLTFISGGMLALSCLGSKLSVSPHQKGWQLSCHLFWCYLTFTLYSVRLFVCILSICPPPRLCAYTYA